MRVEDGPDRQLRLPREVLDLLDVIRMPARIYDDEAVGRPEDDGVAVGLGSWHEDARDEIDARRNLLTSRHASDNRNDRGCDTD